VSSDKVTVMDMRMTADQAEMLLVHHLRLAALLFEAAHENHNTSLNALIQQQVRDSNMPPHVASAARAFVDKLLGWYEGMSMDTEGGHNDR
jgi:hypothetical protein